MLTFPIREITVNKATGDYSLTWASSPGKTYEVQWSKDLTSWNTLPAVIPSAGATTTSSANNPAITGAAKMFWRAIIP